VPRTVLKNILAFTGLVVGVPVSLPHLLAFGTRSVIPEFITADGGGFTITADATNVTVTRTLGAADAVNVCVERWHTIEDAQPPGGLSAFYPFVVAAPLGGGGGGGVGISASGSSQSAGLIVFSNSPTVSFGMSGSTVTASAAGGGGGGVAISGGTQSVSTGTVNWSNSNGISFGLSNSNVMTASFDGVRSLSAGTSSGGGSMFVLSNANNVSFGLNGSVITASVNAAIESVSAGTTLATGPSVLWANSNGMSFGVNGNTVTASFDAIRRVSAGTTLAAGSQIEFGNANGVSFGINGSTITASIAAGAGFAISAGTQSQSTGTVQFSNLNGLSFGLNNGTLTGAIGAVRSIAFIGGGTIADSVTFSNASGVSFITNATNGRVVNLVARPGYLGSMLQDPGMFGDTSALSFGALSLYRQSFAAHVTATQFRNMLNFSYDTIGITETITVSWGVYTLVASTASLASSHSQAFTIDQNVLFGSSPAMFVATGATFNFTPGDYLIAQHIRWNTTNISSGSGTYYGAVTAGGVGFSRMFGGDATVSQQWVNGYSNASFSTAMPASINITNANFVRTGVSAGAQPSFQFLGA